MTQMIPAMIMGFGIVEAIIQTKMRRKSCSSYSFCLFLLYYYKLGVNNTLRMEFQLQNLPERLPAEGAVTRRDIKILTL